MVEISGQRVLFQIEKFSAKIIFQEKSNRKNPLVFDESSKIEVSFLVKLRGKMA